MSSRLSEESLKAVYDTGHQGLAIQTDGSLDLLTGPSVDLDKLLLAEDPEAAVQAVAPQPLFQALMRKGPEDCLDVLPYLSPEQVTRILDYDAWNEDRLSPIKMIRWLNLYKEVSNEELYRRFKGLDEEYQLALLQPIIEMYDEDEYEKLPQEEQDSLHRMPCNTVFFKVKTADARVDEFVSSLIEATLQSDVNYAYALVAHAAYMPPNEPEAEAGRFRKARLEEDGFVTFKESLAYFQPLDLVELKRKWGFALGGADAFVGTGGAGGESALVARDAGTGEDKLFLLKAMEVASAGASPEEFELMTQAFAKLGNALAAAAKVEPDDLGGLKRILQQAQAMASLGLEWLSGGDARVAVEMLKKEHPQVLFRAGLTLVTKLADATLGTLAAGGLAEAGELRKRLRADKRGVVLAGLEDKLSGVLGFERVETLKGLCNRFPVHPVAFTPDEDGAQRVLFRPVTSVASLRQLAAAADGICGLLRLAALASDAPAARPLDRTLLTGLARVLLGGPFRVEALSSDEARKLVEMPAEAAQAVTGDFFSGVEGSLRMALVSGNAAAAASASTADWSPSRAAGIWVEDPVQAVMAEFSDLVMRLHAARAAGVLGGIVELKDQRQEAM